jgi:hypothetical protein
MIPARSLFIHFTWLIWTPSQEHITDHLNNPGIGVMHIVDKYASSIHKQVSLTLDRQPLTHNGMEATVSTKETEWLICCFQNTVDYLCCWIQNCNCQFYGYGVCGYHVAMTTIKWWYRWEDRPLSLFWALYTTSHLPYAKLYSLCSQHPGKFAQFHTVYLSPAWLSHFEYY